MINFEKIKLEKSQPPPPPFKKTCTCTILPPPFFNFSHFPSLGKVIKIYFPPFIKGGGGVQSMHTYKNIL